MNTESKTDVNTETFTVEDDTESPTNNDTDTPVNTESTTAVDNTENTTDVDTLLKKKIRLRKLKLQTILSELKSEPNKNNTLYLPYSSTSYLLFVFIASFLLS